MATACGIERNEVTGATFQPAHGRERERQRERERERERCTAAAAAAAALGTKIIADIARIPYSPTRSLVPITHPVLQGILSRKPQRSSCMVSITNTID